MMDNKECLLTILRKNGALTTTQILSYAKAPEYNNLCSGCASGNDVINAGRLLEEQGVISKRIQKGGYVWSLRE